MALVSQLSVLVRRYILFFVVRPVVAISCAGFVAYVHHYPRRPPPSTLPSLERKAGRQGGREAGKGRGAVVESKEVHRVLYSCFLMFPLRRPFRVSSRFPALWSSAKSYALASSHPRILGVQRWMGPLGVPPSTHTIFPSSYSHVVALSSIQILLPFSSV